MSGNDQQQIAQGLKTLQAHTLGYSEGSYLKLQAMQDAYFSKTSVKYSAEERETIQHYLDSLTHKSHMATLALEQLWALNHDKRNEIWEAIKFSLDTLKVDDNELTIISFAFETFLFHARAYIDFYMLYICYFLKTGHEGSINHGKFLKELGGVNQSQLAEKANKILEYFDTRVYAKDAGKSFVPSNWGTLITSLRDKVAHRDIIKPSFESKETLAHKILLDWPTIRGMTYARFHQDMQNGMDFLIQDISGILYDIKWIPGPYKSGMFDMP